MHPLHELIRGHIDKSGQFVQLVANDEDAGGAPGLGSEFLPFAYTIGNHERDLPELLMIGFEDPGFLQILNLLGTLQRTREFGFTPGEMVKLGKHPMRIDDAGQVGREKYAFGVGVFYGTKDFALRQIVLPDAKGRFPGHPKCHPGFARQPILSAL